MPYIGNTTSDFSIDTGNITNRAVTALKLSPSSVGSNGQVLSVDGSGNLQWSTDAALTLIDEDNMSSNSASSVPSQQSVKAYADTKAVLTGSTNNTITTVTGANALQGETNLTFDGTTLLNNADTAALTLRDSSAYAGNTGCQISFQGKDSNEATKAFATIKGLSVSADNGELRLQTRTGGTLYDRLTILADGNVGIGTTSPASLLHIADATEPAIRLQDTNAVNSDFKIYSPDGDNSLRIYHINTSSDLFHISSGGNVGIGTTSPAAPFHVSDTYHFTAAGGNNTTGMQIGNYDGSSYGVCSLRGSTLRFDISGTEKLSITSAGQILYSAASGDNQIISKRTNAAGSNGNYFFHVKATDNNDNAVGEFGFHRDTAVDDSRFVVNTRNAGGSSTERLRIDSDGRLLLGTQRSYSGQSYYDDITINNSNNASGAAGGTGISLISGNNTWGAILFGDSDDDDVGYIKYAHNGNYMRFGTDAGIRFRIDSDGVKFNGDTAAANALNDYEEGTWTPVANFGTSGSVTVGGGGHFTRVGRIVNITWTFYTTAISSPSGNFTITGLPFSCISDSHSRFGVAFSFIREWNADLPNFKGLISGGTTIYFYKHATNSAGSVQVQGEDFAAGSSDNYLYGSATYMAS